ncbi:hypothetical protein ScPMuIL_000854 [Solemya velum]
MKVILKRQEYDESKNLKQKKIWLRRWVTDEKKKNFLHPQKKKWLWRWVTDEWMLQLKLNHTLNSFR